MTKPQQLEENLGAAKITLSAEDIQALDDLTAPAVLYPAWMQPMGWDEKVKEALGAERRGQSAWRKNAQHILINLPALPFKNLLQFIDSGLSH